MGCPLWSGLPPRRDAHHRVVLGGPLTCAPSLPPLQDKNRKLRPLYDIPYMFEAREFLRKKLIGKKVWRGRGRWRRSSLIPGTGGC